MDAQLNHVHLENLIENDEYTTATIVIAVQNLMETKVCICGILCCHHIGYIVSTKWPGTGKGWFTLDNKYDVECKYFLFVWYC